MAQGSCSEDSDAGSKQINEEEDLLDSHNSGSGSVRRQGSRRKDTDLI